MLFSDLLFFRFLTRKSPLNLGLEVSNKKIKTNALQQRQNITSRNYFMAINIGSLNDI